MFDALRSSGILTRGPATGIKGFCRVTTSHLPTKRRSTRCF